MKRVPAAALIALAFLLGLMRDVYAQDAVVTAVVKEVMNRRGMGQWRNSRVGTSLRFGDQVRTGKRSKAEVKIGPNTVRMSQLTDITIRAGNINLNGGSMEGKFSSRTRVSGGQTTATVKGTDVMFELQSDGSMIIRVLDGGPVDVEWPFGPAISLHGGQQVTIPAPPPPTQEGQQPPPLPPAPKPEPTPPERFAGGVENPDHLSFNTGQTILHFPDTNEQRVVLVSPSTLVARESATQAGAQAAYVPLLAQNTSVFNLPPPPPGTTDTTPPTGGVTVTARSASRAFSGQNYFAPHLGGDTFLYKRNGDRAVWGARIQENGIYDGMFWQVAATPQTLFQGDTSTQLTEMYVHMRNDDTYGDIVIGRQRFVKGPVQNTVTGTLIRQEVMDAVTWSPKLRNAKAWQLDLSYLEDADPLNTRGEQTGFYIRPQYTSKYGSLALNVLKINVSGGGTGASVDFSGPLMPEKLDFYGEIGSDVFGQHIETYGMYFPALYDRYNVDLFVEHANAVGTAPAIWTARAYYQINKQFSALFTADHVYGTGGINLGVGLVAKILK